MLAVAVSPHGFTTALASEASIVPRASHREITLAACLGRVLGAEPQVGCCWFNSHSYSYSLVSHAPLRTGQASFPASGSPGPQFIVPGLLHPPVQHSYLPSEQPWTPSPCIGHCPDHLSTTSPLSPYSSRWVGDPMISLLCRSAFRCPLRWVPWSFQVAGVWYLLRAAQKSAGDHPACPILP